MCQCFDGQFGLRFEATAEDGNVLHELPVEYAISGEKVRQLHVENEIDGVQEESVSEPFQWGNVTIGTLREARTDRHVRFSRRDGCDEFMNLGRGISIVAVHD